MGVGTAITTTLVTVIGGITGYTWGYETPLGCPGDYYYDCDQGVQWAAFPPEFYGGGGWD